MYAVEAVYVEGVSEKSFSNPLNYIVGTKTILDENDIQIFPNPSGGVVSIEIDLPQVAEISITLLNSLGQKVALQPKIQTEQFRQVLDLSDYPKGMYWFEFRVDEIVIGKRLILE